MGSKRLVQASGIIVLIGYVTSALTPNVYLLYFTYGIVTGELLITDDYNVQLNNIITFFTICN